MGIFDLFKKKTTADPGNQVAVPIKEPEILEPELCVSLRTSIVITDPGEYYFQSHYAATTPLEALEMDGKRIQGRWENRPEIKGGRWVMKHHMDYGRWCDIDPEVTIEPLVLKEFKYFLLALRTAFEMPGTYSEKLARMKALHDMPDHNAWYKKTETYHAYKTEKFPELVLWRDMARMLDCTAPQSAVLLSAGYETLESIATATVDSIKKLPKFGQKSAEKAINRARQRLGLPPLQL